MCIKYILKTIILLLVCIFILASCSDNKNESSEIKNEPQNNDNSAIDKFEQPSAEESDLYAPNLPETDFEEYEFKVATNMIDWAIVNINAEEQNSEAVNDAIYQRNRNIEEKYNFIIKETEMERGTLGAKLKNLVKSGTDEYDLVLNAAGDMPSNAINNNLINLYKADYLNFDQPWWNKTIIDNFSIGDKIFFTTSDIDLSVPESVMIVLYSRKLSKDLGLASVEEMYRLVEEDKWTFDKMSELARQAVRNVDGTGVVNPFTDIYGVTTPGPWVGNVMMTGFGEVPIKKDEDNLPYLAWKTQRYADIFEKVVLFVSQKDLIGMSVQQGGAWVLYSMDIFAADRALFHFDNLSVVRLIREMGSDFGVLPVPKYDEIQSRYYSYCYPTNLLGIPTTVSDPNRSAFILEALSAESRRLVIPAYYEIAIQNKYLRDETSYKMLDIILENCAYDLNAAIYNWGGVSGMSGDLYNCYEKGNTDIASLIEKREDKVLKDMQNLIDEYNNLD